MYDNDHEKIFENDEITIINPSVSRAKVAREVEYVGAPYDYAPVDGRVAADMNEYEIPLDGSEAESTVEFASEEPAIEYTRPTAPPPSGPKPKKRKDRSKPKKEKTPYVTKGFMVFALIITMAVSSAIGAIVAINYATDNLSSSSKSYSNLSTGSVAESTGSELTVAEIVAKNENAVVEINVTSTTTGAFGQTTISEGAGSGVIVQEDGYIVTNYHVIEDTTNVSVTLHDGSSYTASVIGYDSENDIAVLKISATDLTAVTIGDSDSLSVGDLAVAIGNPLGQLGGTVTAGIISALERTLTIDDQTMSLIQTDAAINSGNSGGGLFDGYGNLIGIVVAKSSGVGVEGLGFAIPINNVASIIDDLITTGTISSKPSIGISILDLTEEQANTYGLTAGAGVYIAEVTSTEAQEAGLASGDRVVSFNGTEVASTSELVSMVRACEVGDVVTLVISRSGLQLTVTTTLVASTSN